MAWLEFVVYPDHRRVKARKVVAASRRLGARYDAWWRGKIDQWGQTRLIVGQRRSIECEKQINQSSLTLFNNIECT